MKKESVRVNWIDVARGIAISLVLIGHTSWLKGAAYRWVYSFHMPLFFMISGYLFRPKSIEEFLKSRTKRLIIPYLMYTVVYLVIDLFVFKIPASEVFQKAENSILGIDDNLWFIVALFVMEFIFQLLISGSCWLHKSWKLSCVAMIVLIIIGAILIKMEVIFPFRIVTALINLPLLAIGYWLNKNEIFKKVSSLSVMLALMFGSVVISQINGLVDVRTSRYGVLGLYYCGAILGSLAVMIFSEFIKRNIVLEFLGRNSLILYAFNSYVPHVLRLFVPGAFVKILSIFTLLFMAFISDHRKWYKKCEQMH